MSFYQVAKAYLQVDFENNITKLVTQNIRFYQIIMEASSNEWARSYILGNKYNIITTNVVECKDTIIQDVKSLLISPLLKSIKYLIQEWYCTCHNFIKKSYITDHHVT